MIPLLLPRALIDTLPNHAEMESAGVIAEAPSIDGWSWLRPTVLAGKPYDWWAHRDGRLRIAPSLLAELEETFS